MTIYMENKAEFVTNEIVEKTIYVNTQEALVKELGKSLEFDVSLLTQNPSKKFKYEDLGSWLGAVSLTKGETPDIAVNISSDRGKNRVNFKVSDQEAIKSMDQAVTKEQLIYSVALTEAKLKCLSEISFSYIDGDTKKQEESSVLEILEDVTPSIREQIEDYRKEMQEITEAILSDKRDKISLSDLTMNAKFKATATLVVAGLILGACAASPSPIIVQENGKPTISTPAITLTMEAPTEIPTIVPTLVETATPEMTATIAVEEKERLQKEEAAVNISEYLNAEGAYSLENLQKNSSLFFGETDVRSGELPLGIVGCDTAQFILLGNYYDNDGKELHLYLGAIDETGNRVVLDHSIDRTFGPNLPEPPIGVIERRTSMMSQISSLSERPKLVKLKTLVDWDAFIKENISKPITLEWYLQSYVEYIKENYDSSFAKNEYVVNMDEGLEYRVAMFKKLAKFGDALEVNKIETKLTEGEITDLTACLWSSTTYKGTESLIDDCPSAHELNTIYVRRP